MTVTGLDACPAACSALRMTLELFGRTSTARRRARLDRAQDVGRGRVHRLPPVDDAARRSNASNSSLFPAPSDTATRPVCRSPAASVAASRASRSLRLLVHVGDLGLEDLAEPRSERDRGLVVVGVHVHLERGGVADDEERVADPAELALEQAGVQIVPLDDERRAVAIAGRLLVDGVHPERVARDRGRRDRLAGHPGGEPADDLEQARSTGIDHARLTELVEQLGSTGDGLLAASLDPAQKGGRWRAPAPPAPRPPRPSRG